VWNRHLHSDLCNAISAEYGSARLFAVPVNDTEPGYAYPERVRLALQQDDLSSYEQAADFLNFTNFDLVFLQHEYGIFGGPAGNHILTLLRRMKMPVITTRSCENRILTNAASWKRSLTYQTV
jgi:hypothetical protein